MRSSTRAICLPRSCCLRATIRRAARHICTRATPCCAWALDHLDAAYKRFLYPQTYVVGMEQGLAQVRDELVRKNMAAASAFPWAK